jgi:hypothetical protein
LKKRGPQPRQLKDLRLFGVKVFFTSTELFDVDSRRREWPRGVFIRNAALGAELAAPLSNEYITTFQQSARIQADLTQLNQHVRALNELRLLAGELAAAQALAKQVPQVSYLLAEFRASLESSMPSKRKTVNF